MFVHWKRKILSTRPLHRNGDWCDHDAPARETLRAQVRRAKRIDGKPTSETLFAVGIGIRPCCIDDKLNPLVRIAFWKRIAWQFEYPSESKICDAVLMGRAWVESEIAKRVPKPTAIEAELPEFYYNHTLSWEPGDTREERTRRTIDAAWARRTEYQRGRRYRETYAEYQKRAGQGYQRVNVNVGGGATYPSDATKVRAGWVPECLKTLGLRWPCTAVDVKEAFRKLAFLHHPDRGGKVADFIRAKSAYDAAIKLTGAL